MDDPFDLQRFVDAQQAVYAQVVEELSAGAKTSHWMWFIFPQLRALGRSATAKRYGVASLAEAQTYWQHPVLGPRLKVCAERVRGLEGRSSLQIFGSIDELKLCSCMTLFERAALDEPVFALVLEKYFDGRRDAVTLDLL